MPEEVDSNGGEVSDAMSENEHEYDDNDASFKDDDKMTESAIKQEVGPDGEVKKKYDPKDPLRPRRKKARRACFACQRAHLTCGMPMNPNCDRERTSTFAPASPRAVLPCSRQCPSPEPHGQVYVDETDFLWVQVMSGLVRGV